MPFLFLLPEQGGEASLFEVVVKSQGFSDLALLHDYEARAVYQAPALIRAVDVSFQRLLELIRGLGNYFHVRFPEELSAGLAGQFPQILSLSAGEV